MSCSCTMNDSLTVKSLASPRSTFFHPVSVHRRQANQWSSSWQTKPCNSGLNAFVTSHRKLHSNRHCMYYLPPPIINYRMIKVNLMKSLLASRKWEKREPHKRLAKKTHVLFFFSHPTSFILVLFGECFNLCAIFNLKKNN